MDIKEEVWKDAVGFNGCYLVSNLGRVRSTFRSKKILKPKIDKDGYHEYGLRRNGKTIYKRGHRLVAEAFIPNPEKHPVVNHLDGVKANNIVYNLEWTTDAKNTIHAYANLIKTKGKCLSMLSFDEMHELIKLYKDGYSYSKLRSHFNIDSGTDEVSTMISGRRFSEITGVSVDLRRETSKKPVSISDKIVLEILTDYFTNGLTQTECCVKYNKQPSYISRVVTGKRRKCLFDKFKLDYIK